MIFYNIILLVVITSKKKNIGKMLENTINIY